MTIKKQFVIGGVTLMLVVAAVGSFLLSTSSETEEKSDVAATGTEQAEPAQDLPKSYKTLTGDEYKTLFLDSSHPNTKEITQPPAITGDAELDARIVKLAEARGYLLQEVPSTTLNTYEGTQLQQKMNEAWQQLKDLAAAQGYNIKIASGYRSVEEQQQLFVERLGAASSDEQINQVLAMTAPPGYSRHHSGYVVDLEDASSAVFEYSPAYAWLSADNYLVPKQLGIIPSYPEGAQNQGPEPEPWEYVWVGEQLLLQ